MAKDRKSIIETLKFNAPMIFDITMTMDMGYEFSAITEDGVIYPTVGMLLYTEEKGDIPDWWDDNELDEDQLRKKKNGFLKQLDIIPWEEVSTEDLETILAEVEECEY